MLRLLRNHRLVTLAGAPGIGKSRLAQRAAEHLGRRYPDGIWLVELAALADPIHIASAVAQVIGIRQDARPQLDALLAELRAASTLLILDNAEHLVPACASLAAALLNGCPQLSVLVTSRRPLGLTGEAVSRVPPLALPPLWEGGDRPRDMLDGVATTVLPPAQSNAVQAVLTSEAGQLFVTRAQAARPAFTLSPTDAVAVAQLCHQLDGIPLAIELAAARSATLWPGQLANRLRDRFAVLRDGSPVVLPRHRSLRAMVDWSHALLDAAEQVLFRRLSLFAGSFTLEAAEAVADDAYSISALAGLVDASLVVAEEQAVGVRYRLLETLRAYARERLRASGDEAASRSRHQDWYLKLAQRGERGFFGSDHRWWCDQLESELDNLRAALAWASEAPPDMRAAALAGALTTAAALAYFWDIRGHLREGKVWLTDLLAASAPPDGDTDGDENGDGIAPDSGSGDVAAARARATTALAYAHFTTGDAREAERLLVGKLRQIDATQDWWYVAWSRIVLAALALFHGDRDRALSLLDELHTVTEVHHLNTWIASAAFWRGELARSQGDEESAAQQFTRCLDLCRASGNIWGMGYAFAALGRLATMQGDQLRAASLHRQALVVRQQLDDRRGVAFSVSELGLALVGAGEPADGVVLLGAADALYARLGTATVLLPNWQAELTRAFAIAQKALGRAAADSAYRRGTTLSLAEAVEAALSTPARRDARTARGRATTPRLTDRQRAIVVQVADGRTNSEISDALMLSVRTVEWHVSNLLVKLSLRSRAQLTRWGIEHGYVDSAPDVPSSAPISTRLP